METTLQFNGEAHPEYIGQNVTSVLKSRGAMSDNVVVELNNAIVRRENFNQVTFNANDIVEVISFVGGG